VAISRSQGFVPKILPAGRLPAAITRTFEALGLAIPETANLTRQLADGSESRSDVGADELGQICDLNESIRLGVSSGDVGPGTWHYLGIHGGRRGVAGIHVQAPDGAAVEALIEAFMAATDLERYEPSPEPVEAVSPTVTDQPAPGGTATASSARLRAFLSFRFGKTDGDATASYVERLLGLLDVDVITGRGYEPRPVGAKVTERLQGLDFVILIVGANGESAWTRDEIATARAIGVPVIPLVAADSVFERGLFGDLEYITFDPAHPGDVSVPVIEAVTYVRRTRGGSRIA